jgi:uncharacterized membrane-anchored protein YitT (DUF2179 family)
MDIEKKDDIPYHIDDSYYDTNFRRVKLKEYSKRSNIYHLSALLVLTVWIITIIILYLDNIFISFIYTIITSIIIHKIQPKWKEKIMGKYYNYLDKF